MLLTLILSPTWERNAAPGVTMTWEVRRSGATLENPVDSPSAYSPGLLGFSYQEGLTGGGPGPLSPSPSSIQHNPSWQQVLLQTLWSSEKVDRVSVIDEGQRMEISGSLLLLYLKQGLSVVLAVLELTT